MKKLIIALLVVGLLVTFIGPVFADKEGVPNDNAAWGQANKDKEEIIGTVKTIIKDLDMEPVVNWGKVVKVLKTIF